MLHDDEVMELQQQFAEAKHVIQHLAGQVDHYSHMQQQLAGLPNKVSFLCTFAHLQLTYIASPCFSPILFCKPYPLLPAFLTALALTCASFHTTQPADIAQMCNPLISLQQDTVLAPALKECRCIRARHGRVSQ